jgi:hypothetical protein
MMLTRTAARYCTTLLIACTGIWSSTAEATDLATVYPPTLDYAEGAGAVTWTCEPEDVWALTSFAYAFEDQLDIATGPGNVVFGQHEKNVVWAVVLPDTPGTITNAPAGAGETITSIWLRFNPAFVNEIFPPNTVKENGPPDQVVWAKRVFNQKINGSWQAGNQPVIPWKHSLVIDAQTEQGPRRFFMVDTKENAVKYEDFFRTRALPKLTTTTLDAAEASFDTVWNAFDAEYAMFTIKPNVDWNALKDEYRPKLATVKTTYGTGIVLAEMLAHFEDLHVYVRAGNEYIPGYTRDRPINAHFRATSKYVGELTDTKKQLLWSKTNDNIGYINVTGLGNQDLPNTFDQALEKIGDTWALIVDLRYNGGGDETLGQKMAGRFAEQSYVYSKNQYRNGPNHDDLGPVIDRVFEPRGPWRYESPVIVLAGQRTMSSAESFYLMLDQCPNVTTMGDRTAGSSANPRRIDAGNGITVNLPRWLDLLPNGNRLDAIGVTPDIPIDAKSESFTNQSDPVLKAALDRLRAIPEADRIPGWRTSTLTRN